MFFWCICRFTEYQVLVVATIIEVDAFALRCKVAWYLCSLLGAICVLLVYLLRPLALDFPNPPLSRKDASESINAVLEAPVYTQQVLSPTDHATLPTRQSWGADSTCCYSFYSEVDKLKDKKSGRGDSRDRGGRSSRGFRRSRSRERSSDRGRDRGRPRDGSRDRGGRYDRDRDRHRDYGDRDRDRSRKDSRDRPPRREYGGHRDRERDTGRSRDGGRGGGYGRDSGR